MDKREPTFDLIYQIFKRHIDAESHYLVACSLWALHTHIYRKFNVTPRLALLSPVPNCGKSTVLDILQEIIWNPEYLIDPTSAALYRTANEATLLIDEADNMLIVRNMRAILNAGHKAGGSVNRVMGKHLVKFPVYAPVALAAIGSLPNTIMSRAIVIHMHRADPKAKIVRFDKEAQAQDLIIAKSEALLWANQVQLNPDPPLPVKLGGRTADNWRVLIAIADSLDRGEIARNAALKFLLEYKSPDIKIALLSDIRTIFDMNQTRILPSRVLLDTLMTLEDSEYEWSEHQLTQAKMGRMLNDFQIKSQNIWWPENAHRSQQQRLRGYARIDFEAMWRRYATSATSATNSKPTK